jgi:hypothetical protein
VGEQSAVLQLRFGEFAHEDQVLFPIGDEALYFFVVADGRLHVFSGLQIVCGVLVHQC